MITQSNKGFRADPGRKFLCVRLMGLSDLTPRKGFSLHWKNLTRATRPNSYQLTAYKCYPDLALRLRLEANQSPLWPDLRFFLDGTEKPIKKIENWLDTHMPNCQHHIIYPSATSELTHRLDLYPPLERGVNGKITFTRDLLHFLDGL